MNKKVWLSYAWADNKQQDVDFLAQELEQTGLVVKLDRWNVSAGGRLWEQIEKFISSATESDAWILVATQNSLSSEPCKEEFAYALDRALNSRGANFPIIALFLDQVDGELIPAGIRTRLHVSVTDPDWKERINAAIEGRQHVSSRHPVTPYYLKVHQRASRFAIEVRPRAGVWAPFIAAIPLDEKDALRPSIMIGPRDLPTGTGMLINGGQGASQDNSMWLMSASNQSTPTQSYYIWCDHLPSEIVFGVNGRGSDQYRVPLKS